MGFKTVLYERDGFTGILRLNRPERMNAVIEQMYLDIRAVLDEARKDADVRVLVLTGTVRKGPGGDKQAFCAGADLKKHGAGDRTLWQKREYIFLAHETTRMIHEFPKPVIVAVNGPARGAGTEMALNGDFMFMADTATIAFPETGLATCVGGGATYLLTQLVGAMRARELIFTGRILDGPGAVALGLALRSVPVEQLMPEALAFASVLAEKAPVSLALTKDLMRHAPHRDMETVLLAESEAILACMNTEDWHEGIRSFAEKRKPVFKGR
ncbi:MAG: enoyl-CoA hydratase/isomerase family protein [Deltaproteobacteria bacterium]|nr:enoyl-CoA hydratase/isomerase family protein [Deltaproteobacteria bacterium]